MKCAFRAVGGLLIAIANRQPLAAQSTPVIEVGLSAARFTGENVTAVGPQLRLSVAGVQGHFFETVDVGALGTRTAGLAYLGLTAGVRSLPDGPIRHDLATELSAVGTTTSSGRALTGLVGARSTFERGALGSWIRGSSQFASRETNVFFGGSVDAAAWWRFGRKQLSAGLVQEWTRAVLYAGPNRLAPLGTVPVAYLEGSVNLLAENEASVFTVGGTTRRDAGADHLYESSFTASAAYWTGASTAIVLAVAHQLPDYVRGADALDGVSVAVRFGQASPAVARATSRAAIIQFTGGEDTRTVRVHMPDARTVEIMGDFTNWEPRAMTRNGATFESTMRVTSGTHRVMLRLDGGEWKAPANTPTVDDDFGGRVGLLNVP